MDQRDIGLGQDLGDNQRAPIGHVIAPAKQVLLVFLILVVGLSLRLPNLNESLWYDELWSTHIKLGTLSTLYRTSLLELAPPFYHVFMFGWIRLFGDSELSIRLPPLLFGLASIVLLYALASSVVEKKAALLASLLMAASPVHIWYSQEARPYSSLLFFLLLSLLAYVKLEQSSSRRIWFFVYLAALFACSLAHFYLSAYVVLISIICVVQRHPQMKFILSVNVSVLACVAAWIAIRVALVGIPSGIYLRPFTFAELWQLFFNWFPFGNSWAEGWRGTMLAAQLFLLGIFVYGLALMLFRRSERTVRARTVAAYLLALPVLLLLASSFGYRGYVERSMLVAFPFFCIVLAKGATGPVYARAPQWLGAGGPTFMKALGGACILGVAALNVYTLREYFSRADEWTVYKPNPDWRSAAAYLEHELSGSAPQPIFAVVPPLELSYYDSRFVGVKLTSAGQDVLDPNDAQRHWAVYTIGPHYMQHFDDALSRAGAPAFHLVHNTYWEGDFDAVFKTLLEHPGLRHQAVRSFRGIHIHRFSVDAR